LSIHGKLCKASKRQNSKARHAVCYWTGRRASGGSPVQTVTNLKNIETGDKKFWEPRFLNTLGWIRSEAGGHKEALKLNQEALRLALPTGNPETIHNAQINVGENYLQMGDLEKAGKVLEDVRNQIKNKRRLYAGWRYRTRLLIALAELHGKTGEHQKALYFVNQALRAARKNGAAKHAAMALSVKAGIVHESRPKKAQCVGYTGGQGDSSLRLFRKCSATILNRRTAASPPGQNTCGSKEPEGVFFYMGARGPRIDFPRPVNLCYEPQDRYQVGFFVWGVSRLYTIEALVFKPSI